MPKPPEDDELVVFPSGTDKNSTSKQQGGFVEDKEPTRALEVPDEEAMQKTVLIETPFAQQKRTPAKLSVVAGHDKGKDFQLDKDSLIVGRSLDANIVLSDPSVSRKHFELSFKNGRWVLKDLGSQNGTRVGGTRVEGEIALEDGHFIEAGQTVLAFKLIKEEAKEVADTKTVAEVQVKPSPKIEVVLEEKAKPSKIALWVGLGVLAVIVVGAGTFLALRTTEKTEKAQSQSQETTKPNRAKEMLEEGLQRIKDRRFEEAMQVLSEAYNLEPSEEINKALSHAKQERENERLLKEGEEKLKEKAFEDAVALFQRVRDTSVFFESAQKGLKEAEALAVEANIEKILALAKEKKKQEAKAMFLALVEQRPTDERVLSLRGELEKLGVTFTEQEKMGTATPKVAERREGSQAKGRAQKLDVKIALDLYDAGKFSEAAQALRAQVSGVFKEEQSRAEQMAGKIEQFGHAYKDGRQALDGWALDKAEQNLLQALRLDQEIDGHYHVEIRRLLGNLYRAKSAQNLQNADYAQAARNAKKALNYNPEDALASEILGKCVKAGERLFEEAKRAMQAGNKEDAKKKLGVVLEVLPSDHELRSKALDLMNQIK